MIRVGKMKEMESLEKRRSLELQVVNSVYEFTTNLFKRFV